MEYKFTQEISREDYVSFVVNHMKYSFLKPFNIILFTVSIGYLMVSPFLMQTGERNYTFTFIGIGLMVVLGALMVFAKRSAGKQYDKTGGEFKMTYEITDDALVYKVAEGDVTKQWNEFYSAMETEDYLYVYVNKQRGMVIVKRSISDAMVRFIKEKLAANLKPKRLRLMK